MRFIIFLLPIYLWARRLLNVGIDLEHSNLFLNFAAENIILSQKNVAKMKKMTIETVGRRAVFDILLQLLG